VEKMQSACFFDSFLCTSKEMKEENADGGASFGSFLRAVAKKRMFLCTSKEMNK
jgi:hypothetical protein